MDKEALLNIILNDLKEVETLVISFQGENKIADPFINLAERKLTHITEELNLLKTISVSTPKQNTDNLIVPKSVQPQKNESQETTPTPVLEQEINKETQQETKPEITNPEPKESLEPPKSTSIHTNKKDINIAQEDIKGETVTESKTLEDNNIIQESHKSAPVQAPSTIKQEQPTPPPIEKVQGHQHEEKAKTLGESFIGEKRSLNDMIVSGKQDKKNGLIGKPIQDLTKGLAINDRFLFQRELFSGNGDMMKQTLLQLNELSDFNSAVAFIASNFSWDQETETTKAFMNYIKRKY